MIASNAITVIFCTVTTIVQAELVTTTTNKTMITA